MTKCSEPNSKCPICKIELGTHPELLFLSDPTLQDVIDKLLLPLNGRDVDKDHDMPSKRIRVEYTSDCCDKSNYIPFKVILDRKWCKENKLDISICLKKIEALQLLRVDKDTTIYKIKVIHD